MEKALGHAVLDRGVSMEYDGVPHFRAVHFGRVFPLYVEQHSTEIQGKSCARWILCLGSELERRCV